MKKAVIWVAVIMAVVAIVLWLCHSGAPAEHSTVARIQRGIVEGKSEYRKLEIEKSTKLAHDLRVLAKQYVAQGEKRKAHRAIGVAQELDKKIKQLKEEEGIQQ